MRTSRVGCCTNTAEDLLAFSEHCYSDSAYIRRYTRNNQLLMFASFGALGGALGSVHSTTLAVAIGILIGLAALVWTPRWMRKRHRRQAVKLYWEGTSKGTLGAHQLLLTSDQIIETNEYGETKTRWSAVEKVASTRDHTFICLGPWLGHVIPQ